MILAAEGRGLAPARAVEDALETMLQSAAASAACLLAHGATACTDVTGFGLLGHLLEMLRASEMDAALDPAAIPALDGALDLFARGIASSLHADNLSALAALDAGEAHPLAALLIDPQTAGGLLAGVPAERAAACLGELRGSATAPLRSAVSKPRAAPSRASVSSPARQRCLLEPAVAS